MPPAQPILAVGERQLRVGKATYASGRDWGAPGGVQWVERLPLACDIPGVPGNAGSGSLLPEECLLLPLSRESDVGSRRQTVNA